MPGPTSLLHTERPLRCARIAAIIVLTLVVSETVAAQPAAVESGRIPVRTYAEQFGAEPAQTWAALRDDRGIMFFGARNGVYEFDGASWRLITTPQERPVFGLARGPGGAIYVAGEGLAGVLIPDARGRLRYGPLVSDSLSAVIGTLRRVHSVGERIVFTGDRAVLMLESGAVAHWPAANGSRFVTSFVVADVVYIQDREGGHYAVARDGLRQIRGPLAGVDSPITSVAEIPEGGVLLTTEDGSFWAFDGVSLTPAPLSLLPQATRTRLAASAVLSSGHMALGTRSEGITFTDARGQIIARGDLSTGLPSNYVRALHDDGNGSLWAMLDIGVVRIPVPPRLTMFDQRDGLPGSVEDVYRHRGSLYVSTLNGLFRLRPASADQPARFVNVRSSANGCFALLSVDEALLAACEDGVIAFESGGELPVLRGVNAITLERSRQDPNVVYAGLTEGLAILRREGATWRREDLREPFSGFVRHTFEAADGTLWITTRHEGVHALTTDGPGRALRSYGPEDGLPPGRIRVFEFEGQPLFRGSDGMYRVTSDRRWVRDTTFDDVFPEDMLPIRWSRVPGLEQVHLASRSLDAGFVRLTGEKRPLWMPISEEMMPRGRTYALLAEPDGAVWLGGTYGLVRLYATEDPVRSLSPAVIRSVEKITGDSLYFGGFGLPAAIRLPNDGGIRISYAAPYSGGEGLQYLVTLRGPGVDWTILTTETYRDLSQLRGGRYVFTVRASTSDGLPGEAAMLEFFVPVPWSQTVWARLVYLLMVLAALAGGIRWRTRRLDRRAESLERMVEARTRVIEERTRQLADANEQLHQQKERVEEYAAALLKHDEMKNRFFTDINHELRTPLTLILGPAEDLIADTDDGLPSRFRQQISMIERNARRLLRLVNQLLDLARLEAGMLQPALEALHIGQAIRTLLTAFKPLADQRGVILECTIPDREMIARMDPDHLEKIVGNLLTNALKATEGGGRISVRVFADETLGIGIDVADTGIGIASDQLEAIFDRFSQAPSNSFQRGPGTGIGLNLARELAALYRGTISAESTEGVGSTFSVRLPLEYAIAPATANPKAAHIPELTGDEAAVDQQPPGYNATILVVDDEPDLRALLRRRLARDYQVIEADSADAAFELAMDIEPDCIVLDVMMPGRDGLDLCSALKSDPRLGHIPVILLTARGHTNDRIQGLKTGADDYLVKPFDAADLSARIANLVRGRQALRARFSTEIVVGATGVRATSVDASFLNRLKEAIENRMEDPEFAVEELADLMGVSTSQLLRRTRELLGETPVQVVRRIRLERAAMLLSSRAGSVSEIGFRCGFNSQSYFARAFKQHYNLSPSDFLARQAPTPE
jgi:signal transduction histidine kinase/DNA-binding response OmpR family regulator